MILITDATGHLGNKVKIDTKIIIISIVGLEKENNFDYYKI